MVWTETLTFFAKNQKNKNLEFSIPARRHNRSPHQKAPTGSNDKRQQLMSIDSGLIRDKIQKFFSKSKVS